MFGKIRQRMQLCASGKRRTACCLRKSEGNTLGLPQHRWPA